MHEMSVATDLLALCEQHLKEHNGRMITRVNLVVGQLAGIVPDSLEFCFNIIKKDTAADRAELAIRMVQIDLVCRDCGQTFTVEELPWMCENCGSIRYDLKAGNEFMVESILID